MLLDANGRVPTPKSAHERKWTETKSSGSIKAAREELLRRQSLPLDEKIAMSLSRIKDWYEAWDGNVSVSFSGGKDSSVLLWLVRQLYPDVPAVFCHTGLEYPEILKAVKSTDNHIILRPKMPFHKVVKKYGWPVGSKKIARGINVLKNPTDNNRNTYRLYDKGINRHGEFAKGFKVSKCWRFLIKSPFRVSDHCCSVMKEGPASKFEKETGRKPFVGKLATDSSSRCRSYLGTGCNAYDAKNPSSAPLSFWTEQDVLRFILENKLQIPSVYGKIVDTDGKLQTTGVSRTGCVFCCFGLHMNSGNKFGNRFQNLAVTHPNLYQYCMTKLGLKDVLRWCKMHAPGALADSFSWDPRPIMEQGSLFGVTS